MTGKSEKTETIRMRGTIERIHFSSDTWSAGKIIDEDGHAHKFAGKVRVKVDDEVELIGAWKHHPKFGMQIDVMDARPIMSLTVSGLARVLMDDKDLPGIGGMRSLAIASAVLLYADANTPECVASVSKNDVGRIASKVGSASTPALVAAACASIAKKIATYTERAALIDCGWTQTESERIIDAHLLHLATVNPYDIIGRVERIAFKTADRVAVEGMKFPRNDKRRIHAGIVYTLDVVTQRGSTWIHADQARRDALKILEVDAIEDEDLVGDMIVRLVEDREIICRELPTEDGPTSHLAPVRLARFEAHVFDEFRKRAATHNAHIVPTSGNAANNLSMLNEGQYAAAHAALTRGFCVISGPGGTGKTHTARAIAHAALDRGEKVALLTPTGKASRRLADATGLPAATIHRATGFGRGAMELEATFIIVDEASMVDVEIMSRLLALSPDCETLVLIGDHNQLPSVAPGAILRDLYAQREHLCGAMCELTEIHRSTGALAVNSVEILRSNLVTTQTPDWFIAREASNVGESVARMIETGMRPDGDNLKIEDVQVIAPCRKGEGGVNSLNIALQAWWQKREYDVTVDKLVGTNRAPKVLVGDRVIWTRNNYEVGIMNGTMGTLVDTRGVGPDEVFILRVDDGEDNETLEIPASLCAEHMQVAYAITIHKSQGSEWPVVIVSIPQNAAFVMADRNLLYTATSRAKKACVIIGQRTTINQYVKSKRSDERTTCGQQILAGWQAGIGWPKPFIVDDNRPPIM